MCGAVCGATFTPFCSAYRAIRSDSVKPPWRVESNCTWSRILAHCKLEVKDFTIPNKSKYSQFEDGRNAASYEQLLPWEREYIASAGKKLIEDFDFKPPEV